MVEPGKRSLMFGTTSIFYYFNLDADLLQLLFTLKTSHMTFELLCSVNSLITNTTYYFFQCFLAPSIVDNLSIQRLHYYFYYKYYLFLFFENGDS